MVKYIPVLISTAVLIYGGVNDYKRREIPNVVPIVLLAAGSILNKSLIHGIIGLVVPAVVLFAAARITMSELPGGDFKLLCSLGFACGLLELTAIIFIAGFGAVACGFVRNLPIKRHIPLCSYIAPAYIVFQVTALVLEGR